MVEFKVQHPFSNVHCLLLICTLCFSFFSIPEWKIDNGKYRMECFKTPVQKTTSPI